MKTPIIWFTLTVVLLCPFSHGQWAHTKFPDSLNVNCFGVRGTNLFAGTEYNGVFLSTDNGTSWTAVNGGFPKYPYDTTHHAPVRCLASSGQHLFAGTLGCGVVTSTDNGTSRTSTGLTNNDVGCLAFSGLNVFAGTDIYGVLLSTNNGTSWTPVNSGLPRFNPVLPGWHRVEALALSGTNLMAVINISGSTNHNDSVFLTTNSGTSWIPATAGWTHPYITAFAACGTDFVAAIWRWGGLFRRSTSDTIWTKVAEVGAYCFAQSGSSLFAGASGVILSTDSGTNWTAVNEGFPGSLYGATYYVQVRCLVSCGQHLFASTTTGVWRRPLSELITKVKDSMVLPTAFALLQNYPNPFNPTTAISYQSAVASEVRLVVFDMLGRVVAVLVNEKKDAGFYEVKFDGSNHASGIYIYRLQAGDYIDSKKLVLLK